MNYIGMRPVNSVVYVYVTTHAQTGAAVAPSSALEAGDFLLYKNGSATQRSSTAGWTITSPFDSITGLHLLAIDLSDNTDAGFYAAGSNYSLVLSPDETIDGLVAVRVVATFDIGVQPANVTEWLGTAPATPTVAGVPEVDITHVGGATSDVSALATNVAAILVDTGTTLDARIPAALVGGRMDSSIGAMAANVLTASAINTAALTNVKFAAGAIDAAALATDAVEEIRDAVFARTMTELTGDPGATPSFGDAVMLPYMGIRNARVTDSGAGTDTIANSAGSVILTASISDAANVFTKAKYA